VCKQANVSARAHRLRLFALFGGDGFVMSAPESQRTLEAGQIIAFGDWAHCPVAPLLGWLKAAAIHPEFNEIFLLKDADDEGKWA
jgi:hypothetical protein